MKQLLEHYRATGGPIWMVVSTGWGEIRGEVVDVTDEVCQLDRPGKTPINVAIAHIVTVGR